jgi:signal transduction histidine kinase
VRNRGFAVRLTPGQLVAIDVAVALVVLVRTVIYAFRAGGLPPWLGVTVGCVAACAIALRRWRPLWMLAAVTLGASAAMLLGDRAVGTADGLLFAVALVLYTVAATRPAGAAGIVLVAVAVPLLSAALVTSAGDAVPLAGQGTFGAVYVAVVILAAWSIGLAAHATRQYRQGLRDQAAQHARATADAERMRIARELHDVVAHAMSVIAVQAGVGRYVIHEQPVEAEKSLAAIETTSRAALADLRRLVGVLRDGRPGDLLPTPGIADLPELADQVEQAGLAVELTVRDVPARLPAGLDLVAFRVVQEALTNVMKHADTARSRVLVCCADDTLRIEVTDDGAGLRGGGFGDGHGLVGMRERVVLYGGEFEAGPLPQRGFRVAARLPV